MVLWLQLLLMLPSEGLLVGPPCLKYDLTCLEARRQEMLHNLGY